MSAGLAQAAAPAAPVDVKSRTRAGTYDSFEKRYDPIVQPDDTIMLDHKDLPVGIDERLVWTVVDCDGTLYLTPGFATINYMGRVVCRKPWSDIEQSNPGYRY